MIHIGAITDGIAIDVVSRLLYYTDTGRKLVAAMSLNGTFHVTLVTGSMEHPRAIALDPVRG